MKRSSLWRGATVALILMAAAGAAGCGRRARLAHARAARHQRRLLRLAARDTGCRPEQLTPGQIARDVYTVLGCTQPVEYLLACGRRCRWRRIPTLNEAAAPVLQCQPQLIQQQPTQEPGTRYAVGCGRQAAFTIQCVPSGCGWAFVEPASSGAAPRVSVEASVPPPPGAAADVPPPPGAAADVPPPPGQAAGAPGAPAGAAAIQARLATQREAIMSCVDVPSVDVTVRWAADGTIRVALPAEISDPAAEGCIQSVVRDLRVESGQPGEIVVSIR